MGEVPRVIGFEKNTNLKGLLDRGEIRGTGDLEMDWILKEGLKILPGYDLEVLMRYIYYGNTIPEIACDFGVSVERIKQIKDRALLRLKGYLYGETGDCSARKERVKRKRSVQMEVNNDVPTKVRPHVQHNKTQSELVPDWNRDDFSRYLIEIAQGTNFLRRYDQYPAEITPREEWRRQIELVRAKNYQGERIKKFVVTDHDGGVRFSNEIPIGSKPLGFDGKSLVDGDTSGKFALKIIGDINLETLRMSDLTLERILFVKLESVFELLADKDNLMFRLMEIERGGKVWIFKSAETKDIFSREWYRDVDTFRDRWLKEAGVVREGLIDTVFSSQGVPWMHENKNVWRDACLAACRLL